MYKESFVSNPERASAISRNSDSTYRSREYRERQWECARVIRSIPAKDGDVRNVEQIV